jgi:hypothetical protein
VLRLEFNDSAKIVEQHEIAFETIRNTDKRPAAVPRDREPPRPSREVSNAGRKSAGTLDLFVGESVQVDRLTAALLLQKINPSICHASIERQYALEDHLCLTATCNSLHQTPTFATVRRPVNVVDVLCVG